MVPLEEERDALTRNSTSKTARIAQAPPLALNPELYTQPCLRPSKGCDPLLRPTCDPLCSKKFMLLGSAPLSPQFMYPG